MDKGQKSMMYYTPKQAAALLAANAHTIRIMARNGKTPYPCELRKSRVLIPRRPLDEYIESCRAYIPSIKMEKLDEEFC